MTFRNAYFIKLGRGGSWEKECIENGLMRIGWEENPLTDVNAQKWNLIEKQLTAAIPHKGTATGALNALKYIVLSNEEDVWITFHDSHLWWCRVAAGPVEEDATSKFRRTTLDGWSKTSTSGQTLPISGIPGEIAQLQGYRGTLCRVNKAESLRRLLAGVASPAFGAVSSAMDALAAEVSVAIRSLHWKDFETLVDLLFRQAGWRRLSVLGGTMKFADLELEEPVTGERYIVQIKSTADASEFARYRDEFTGQGYRKLYFVVHTPTGRLDGWGSEENVELILPERLGRMVVDAGLVRWVLAKIR